MFLQSALKKALFLFCTALFVSFTACKGDKSQKDEAETEKTETGPQDAESDHAGHDHGSDTNGEVALNPPHGQPGHRCDIPVGQPLDSESQSPTINVSQPGSSSDSPVVKENADGQKLNPPHGQPGHRCDIQVGQPLPE